MTRLSKLLAGFAVAALLSGAAFAQSGCGGQFGAGKFCGNAGGSTGLPGPVTLTPGVLAPIAGGTVLGNPSAISAVPQATATPVFGIPGSVLGSATFSGNTSGSVVVRPQAAAGTPTLLLPNTSGTFAATATSPLSLSATTGLMTCPTCVTSSGGGAITGTPPINVSAAGVVSVTQSALTRVDDTNVTLTLGGSPSTALLASTSITAGWTGQLGLTRGGTGASLTASNGGLVYSTGAGLAILNGTATANQIPLSGSNAAPAWSTATYPATAAAGTVLGASSANVIGATAQPVLGANGGTGGQVTFNGSTSGSTALRVPAAAGTGTVFQLPPNNGTNTYVLQTDGNGVTTWVPSAGGGTVTSVGWTGGIVSVATPTTTPAFTVAGTSGGIPYFDSASSWASSGALGANAVVIGGGAGAAPTTTHTSGAFVSSTSATSFRVTTGTNNTFVVDNSTASAATGVQVVSAAAGSRARIAAISSGTNEDLTVDAKGSGGVVLGVNSTGTNTSVRPFALGVAGSIAGQLALLNATSGSILLNPTTGALGSTVITVPAVSGTLPIKIASGTSAMGTGAISSATCASVVTTSATGVATTDTVNASFNGDPTAVTGYVPLTSGMLTIVAYPTANNVNFKVCNNTGSSITPGAITLNWIVMR